MYDVPITFLSVRKFPNAKIIRILFVPAILWSSPFVIQYPDQISSSKSWHNKFYQQFANALAINRTGEEGEKNSDHSQVKMILVLHGYIKFHHERCHGPFANRQSSQDG